MRSFIAFFTLVFVFIVQSFPLYAEDKNLSKLNSEIQSLQKGGKIKEAIERAEEYAELVEDEFSEESNQYSSALQLLLNLKTKKRDFEGVDQIYNKLIKIQSKLVGADHPNVGVIYMRMSLFHQRQEKYKIALGEMKRALGIFKKAFGAQHGASIALLTGIGNMYYRLGDFQSAESYLRQAIHLNEKKFGSQSIQLGGPLNILGQLYDANGKYKDAEKVYQRLFDLRKKTYGDKHYLVGLALSNLSLVYLNQGRYLEAKSIMETSLKIIESKLSGNEAALTTALGNLASINISLENYDKAEELFERVLEIEKDSRKTTSYATTLTNLASLHQKRGAFKKAEKYMKQALALFIDVLGEKHFKVATLYNNLALLYEERGEYVLAEDLHLKSIAIKTEVHDRSHPNVFRGKTHLATLYSLQGLYKKSQKLLLDTLEEAEKEFGLNSSRLTGMLSRLGENYREQGLLIKAEKSHLRSLEILKKKTGNAEETANVYGLLALAYQDQGKFQNAETALKKGISIKEKVLGSNHPSVGFSLNNLASLYHDIGRLEEAEELYKKSIEIQKKVYGLESLPIANLFNNLATLYRDQSLLAETRHPYKKDKLILNKAKRIFIEAIEIQENILGKSHPRVASTLNNLALVYDDLEFYEKAKKIINRTLEIRKKTYGENHTDVALSLNNLAAILVSEERFEEALDTYKQASAIWVKTYGVSHPQVAIVFENIGRTFVVQKKWKEAYQYFDKAKQIYIRHARLSGAISLTTQDKNIAQLNPFKFKILTKVGYRYALEQKELQKGISDQLFRSVQWMTGAGASAALSQLAVRFLAEDQKLSDLIRERQDLRARWQALDRAIINVKSYSSKRRNRGAEINLQMLLEATEKRISEIDILLKKEFPDYSALSLSQPLSVKSVQDTLKPDEALVYFVNTRKWENTSDETFIWVVTKNDTQWVKSDLGTKALDDMVTALRCGLDSSVWQDKRKTASCSSLLKSDYSYSNYRLGQPLPFDTNTAFELYKGLFGEVEGLIKNKKLLLVPSGALTALPFQVLLTKKPHNNSPYSKMDWLVNQHTLKVLPSVSSLQSLRQVTKASEAKKAYLGFGNPLLTGPNGTDESAWKKVKCDFEKKPVRFRLAGFILPDIISKYFRGGIADIESIRRQTPLPETADELCAVAELLKSGQKSVKLGAQATEITIKQMSETGELRDAKVLHFATHGLLSGETQSLIQGEAEPSLILTPPDHATPQNDGLLTASEISQLKLDADWVILSACNTAAGEKPGSEALSGLAKAFFYAGARSLLVSHWYVNSDATVKLVTRSFNELAERPKLGQAGALREAMRSLIQSNNYSHPEFWAPFVMVGLGTS